MPFKKAPEPKQILYRKLRISRKNRSRFTETLFANIPNTRSFLLNIFSIFLRVCCAVALIKLYFLSKQVSFFFRFFLQFVFQLIPRFRFVWIFVASGPGFSW